MCEKQLIDFFVFDFITNQDQSQEMCNSIICADPFSLTYVPNQYKTKQMYDKKDKNILYFNEDSVNVVFSCNEMGIVNIDLNIINLDNKFE